jgi:hypothetical protein
VYFITFNFFSKLLLLGDTMEFSGLGDRIVTGILLKDGWIEYGSDKYPDLDSWTLKVFKENKKRKTKVPLSPPPPPHPISN